MEKMMNKEMGEKNGFVDLKESDNRLDKPSDRYPSLHLSSDQMKKVFKGSKIGESYEAMIRCTLDGSSLKVFEMKVIGTTEKEPKVTNDKGGSKNNEHQTVAKTKY